MLSSLRNGALKDMVNGMELFSFPNPIPGLLDISKGCVYPDPCPDAKQSYLLTDLVTCAAWTWKRSWARCSALVRYCTSPIRNLPDGSFGLWNVHHYQTAWYLSQSSQIQLKNRTHRKEIFCLKIKVNQSPSSSDSVQEPTTQTLQFPPHIITNGLEILVQGPQARKAATSHTNQTILLPPYHQQQARQPLNHGTTRLQGRQPQGHPMRRHAPLHLPTPRQGPLETSLRCVCPSPHPPHLTSPAKSPSVPMPDQLTPNQTEYQPTPQSPS